MNVGETLSINTVKRRGELVGDLILAADIIEMYLSSCTSVLQKVILDVELLVLLVYRYILSLTDRTHTVNSDENIFQLSVAVHVGEIQDSQIAYLGGFHSLKRIG